MTRLIDADALKKAIHSYENRQIPLDTVIDNAPTVEVTDYDTGYQDGLEDGLNDMRPTGEWESYFEMNGKTYHKCSCCHISTELILINNYCPSCGADMRGDDHE